MREWEKERDRETESDSSGSITPPTPFPASNSSVNWGWAACPFFLLFFLVDRVAWRTSRCYGHHSSGWASVGPRMQGPPRQRKSIEIRTRGRALKAVPAKQEDNRKRCHQHVFKELSVQFPLQWGCPSGSLDYIFIITLHHGEQPRNGKQRLTQPCSNQIPQSRRENMHQRENKRNVYQRRTQAQHYAERFLTMEESFIVTRLLSPSIPMFMITPCQTTSTVCSAAWQQGLFNDKCWHWFQNGILPRRCNAERMMRSVHLISAAPYCRL